MLMGPYEIAQRMGVSRQRFQQFTRHPTVPRPYQELRGMKVWLAEDVEEWIRKHRPPRPTEDDTPSEYGQVGSGAAETTSLADSDQPISSRRGSAALPNCPI